MARRETRGSSGSSSAGVKRNPARRKGEAIKARRARRSGARNRASSPPSPARDRLGRSPLQPVEMTFEPLDDDDEAGLTGTARALAEADAMVGDEAAGGSVEVSDHDSVDEWGSALGVERSPDSPVRSSAELLDERDRRRGSRSPSPKL